MWQVANRRVRHILLGVALLGGGALQAQDAVPPTAPVGAPKSLLPDDIAPAAALPANPAERPPPEPAVAILPSDAPPARQPPPFAPEAAAALLVPEVEALNPLADLAGPVGQPEDAGLLTPATGGYGADLFARSDGRFLAVLLHRIEAPVASRWAQILLTRALLSRAAPPAGLNPANWVAARADALVATGSATDAHRMVSRIALDRYTQSLYSVAGHAALAAGDPIALCPLATTAFSITEMPFWQLSDAMCSAVLGDDFGASQQFDRLRKDKALDGFDIGLAERIASAAGGGRRAANPEWQDVSGLTAWRIGLSSAAGLDVPDSFLGAASLAQKAWLVRLPGQSVARRATLGPVVAASGAISSAEVNRLFAAEAATLDPTALASSPGGQLRVANNTQDSAQRIQALKALWSRAEAGSPEHYGWLVATALAAARVPPSAGSAADSPEIAAALVSAGLTREASAWWPASADLPDAQRARLWAQLVAIDPSIQSDDALFQAWSADAPPHRAALLSAGLAGLGRKPPDDLPAAIDNLWTRALDRAVAGRRTGEVMLLTATGLQGRWRDVPPDYLRRIAAALSAVGHAAEARLIVAEAASRG